MLERINQAFEITKQIQTAAQQGNWDEVERLQLSREQLTIQVEGLPIPEDALTTQTIGQIISEIQNIDAQITPLLEKQRKALIDEKLQNNKGRRMAKAYQAGK